MASEAISEHLISKKFLWDHAPRCVCDVYACMHTYKSDTYVILLLKILAMDLNVLLFGWTLVAVTYRNEGASYTGQKHFHFVSSMIWRPPELETLDTKMWVGWKAWSSRFFYHLRACKRQNVSLTILGAGLAKLDFLYIWNYDQMLGEAKSKWSNPSPAKPAVPMLPVMMMYV